MEVHYSQPKGFVGRNICYEVRWDGVTYGYIVGGSACLHLPGRNEFFGIKQGQLNSVVNNLFYHVEKVNDRYPCRNFTIQVLVKFMDVCARDWQVKYGDHVIGFETLVELPRTGELYAKAGWLLLGETKGYTVKRVAGQGTDSWTGQRIWNTKDLRPKLVFAIKYDFDYSHLSQIKMF